MSRTGRSCMCNTRVHATGFCFDFSQSFITDIREAMAHWIFFSDSPADIRMPSVPPLNSGVNRSVLVCAHTSMCLCKYYAIRPFFFFFANSRGEKKEEDNTRGRVFLLFRIYTYSLSSRFERWMRKRLERFLRKVRFCDRYPHTPVYWKSGFKSVRNLLCIIKFV